MSQQNLSAAKQSRELRSSVTEPVVLQDAYGENTFGIAEMSKRLPKEVVRGMINCINLSAPIATQHADFVALSMREWAIERGATHFVHWFQPLTGGTAGKHDSFINPTQVGQAVTQLRGKDLIQGEPDASSFPNGGLRATHEARGYTVWDPTSPAFLVENPNGCFLAIPTCFVSWTGDALDHKTPLLRSIDALDRQARRVLRQFGKSVERVQTTVGCEQEYFLIDEEFYYRRPDLIACGRTLLGAAPPKGQQLDDHYFGEIPARVLACLLAAELELTRLGVPVKTRHNEVAPSQYEVAPVFEFSGVASDHQQLTMITLKKVAREHGLMALLHEKPFAGLNGSGKHVNWSIGTDTGENLLDPGRTPHENLQFLFFCTAVVRAVYKHQDLLRISVSSAGNDHRLGANEAPPAIMSVFLGKQLYDIYQQLVSGDDLASAKDTDLFLGVTVLPLIPRHAGDRNRTSPFAFTGNKFEFRSAGSAQSVAFPNVVLNLAVAESLDVMAALLKQSLKGKDASDPEVFKASVLSVLRDQAIECEDVLFEGDNYDPAWHAEAEQRGLLNMRSSVEALQQLTSEKNIRLFSKYGVLSERELEARMEIALEQYEIAIDIEARTALNLARTYLLPAAVSFLRELLDTHQLGASLLGDQNGLTDTASELGNALNALRSAIEGLEAQLDDDEHADAAEHMRDSVVPAMGALREAADALELLVPRDKWPLPSYSEMLFIN